MNIYEHLDGPRDVRLIKNHLVYLEHARGSAVVIVVVFPGLTAVVLHTVSAADRWFGLIPTWSVS